jgi:hypothetical protein
MKTRTSLNHRTFAFAYVLLVAVIFCGCDDMNRAEERSKVFKAAVEVNGYQISIIEFDSCQYLISGVGYSQMMTHKGNCKFCTERSKK